MHVKFSFAANLALLAFANAQAGEGGLLSTAIDSYDDLSLFRSLLEASPQALQNVLSERSTNITVLVPTNDAITTYLSSSGIKSVSSLRTDDLEIFFSYHIMSASLKSTDFDDKRGSVVPTLLKKSEFNNRTAGAQLTQEYGAGSAGQVLVASSASASTRRFKRQDMKGPTVNLRAGLAQDAKMTAIDGAWGTKNVNTFQVVDSVLLPPRACSTTIRSIKDQLSALDTALNKTTLWPTLDTTPNVTCLAPSTSAFKAAGNPQESLPKDNLTHALLAHTLKEVTYTTFLTDGMVLETYDNSTVTVHIKGDDIYFNNAKIIEPNVLTNNGLLHILDSLIEAETDKATGTSTASSDSPSSTSSASSSPSESGNAASASSLGFHGLVAVIAGFAMM